MTRHLRSLTRARAGTGASHTSTHQQKAYRAGRKRRRRPARDIRRERRPERHTERHTGRYQCSRVRAARGPCEYPVPFPCSTWCSTPRRRPSHVRKFCRRAKPRLRAWQPTGSRSAWSLMVATFAVLIGTDPEKLGALSASLFRGRHSCGRLNHGLLRTSLPRAPRHLCRWPRATVRPWRLRRLPLRPRRATPTCGA